MARTNWPARSGTGYSDSGRAVLCSLTFAPAGFGSGTHLSGERFRISAGIRVLHVPFKGTPEMITELMAGRIDYFFGPVGIVLPHVRDGQLLALAVNSLKRASALPDVPTIAETGFVDAEYPNWFGVFLPAKTPREITNKLHAEMLIVLQTSKILAQLETLGIEPMTMAPVEFDEYVKAEIGINAALAKVTSVKAN